jgi:hypothetical protein
MGMLLHRLVALTFLPNVDNKETVNHIDHNTLNNAIDNLEWFTQNEQNKHKSKPSTHKRELVSSRKILLKNIISGEDFGFSTMVNACKFIYDENPDKFTCKTFNEVKNSLKAKVCTFIRNGTENSLFNKYKLVYLQEEYVENEIWKEIPPSFIDGKCDCSISTKGRAKNSKGRITTGYVHTNGYTKVALESKCRALHRLVGQVFLPNPENKKQINHKDGNKQNNSLDNLEWADASDNCIHRTNILHVKYLKKVFQYDLQLNFIKEYKSITEASIETNISKFTISSCCNKKQRQSHGFIFRFEKTCNLLNVN